MCPSKSAWTYFNGPFDFSATPMGPMGCKIIVHSKPDKRKSWDQRGREGYILGPAIHHYRCWTLLDASTKAVIISDTAEFLHSYITQPTVTPAGRITHAMHILTGSLADAPTIHSAHQLRALKHLRTALENWRTCYRPQQPTVPTEVPPINPPAPVDRTQESIQ